MWFSMAFPFLSCYGVYELKRNDHVAEMNTSNVKLLRIQKNLDLASGYLCTLIIRPT